MHEWILTSEGQTLAQLVTAQEALGNTVLQQDADNSRVLVETVSGGSGLANALVYKGATDCSGNPNYPAADAGHLYIVSVAGKIGGASGISVEAGDSFICKTDGTAAGTQAQRGASWNVVQGNTVGALLAANNLSDVASAATARTNLVLGSVDNTSDASKPVSTAQQTALDLKVPTSYLDTDIALTANSDLKVATQKATKAYVDANAGGGGVTSVEDATERLALLGLTVGAMVFQEDNEFFYTLIDPLNPEDAISWASTPKLYSALLGQSGTADPVATVLINTLGFDIVWTRQSAGHYIGTTGGTLPTAKTLLLCRAASDENEDVVYLFMNGESFVNLQAQVLVTGEAEGSPVSFGAAGDDNLLAFPVRIERHP